MSSENKSTHSSIRIIAAVEKNFGIGKDNSIPWRLSADMKQFSSLTKYNYVLMGRKTFESIGKPLKNRVTLIITTNKDYKVEGAYVFNTIEDAIAFYKEKNNDQILYICGGAGIYKDCVDKADELCLSFVQAHVDCDTFFPPVDLNKWQLIDQFTHPIDEKNEYEFIYNRLIRR